ncbi:hypothetical protein A4A49_01320 [Nicotiana attenuata]|uniref:Putative plant transposon protein domain-containing protein n=1 Tax=Nicotiana attenuata TaxID=49451 RepID=A0A1J6IZ89_NICAT|nr:hypothetical protein A4A49_01320 [Nicotiana attenuata]
MSRRPRKCSNTSSSEVASSSRRGGRQAHPPAPMEEEEERIDPDANVVPDCKYGIWVVPAHSSMWYRTFVPVVSLDPEFGIDDGKLARKYSGIYNNIRYLGFESLFRLGESVNVNIAKELYANWQPEATLGGVYEVEVRGKTIPFSSRVINQIMGLTKHSHKLFLRLLCRPPYPDIRCQLCGARSLATWTRDANELHKDMKKCNFQRSARVILRLIKTDIMPTQNDTDVSRFGCLIYAILTRMKFDLGKIMLEHMARVRPLGARRLYFSSMFTRLLRTRYVEEEYHYDWTISVLRPLKPFDVTALLFADMRLRAARGKTDLVELQEDRPLSAVTRQWLGLDDGAQMPSYEDLNSLPSDNE